MSMTSPVRPNGAKPRILTLDKSDLFDFVRGSTRRALLRTGAPDDSCTRSTASDRAVVCLRALYKALGVTHPIVVGTPAPHGSAAESPKPALQSVDQIDMDMCNLFLALRESIHQLLQELGVDDDAVTLAIATEESSACLAALRGDDACAAHHDPLIEILEMLMEERDVLRAELEYIKNSFPEELRQQILHIRSEALRMNRSRLDVRQGVAGELTALLNRWTSARKAKSPIVNARNNSSEVIDDSRTITLRQDTEFSGPHTDMCQIEATTSDSEPLELSVPAMAVELIKEAWRLLDGQDPKTVDWHITASRFLNNKTQSADPVWFSREELERITDMVKQESNAAFEVLQLYLGKKQFLVEAPTTL